MLSPAEKDRLIEAQDIDIAELIEERDTLLDRLESVSQYVSDIREAVDAIEGLTSEGLTSIKRRCL